MRLITS